MTTRIPRIVIEPSVSVDGHIVFRVETYPVGDDNVTQIPGAVLVSHYELWTVDGSYVDKDSDLNVMMGRAQKRELEKSDASRKQELTPTITRRGGFGLPGGGTSGGS